MFQTTNQSNITSQFMMSNYLQTSQVYVHLLGWYKSKLASSKTFEWLKSFNVLILDIKTCVFFFANVYTYQITHHIRPYDMIGYMIYDMNILPCYTTSYLSFTYHEIMYTRLWQIQRLSRLGITPSLRQVAKPKIVDRISI